MTLRRFFLLGTVLLLSSRLSATSVVPPPIDSLIAQSDYVVRAVAKSVTPEWKTTAEGKPYISTKVELEVLEVIKGTPPGPLVLELLGGRIGENELIVTGMPVFHVGDENILFVHGEQKKVYPLVAMMHGVYPIMREAKSGQDYVLRSNGLPLYDASEVSLPIDQASAALSQNPAARPLSAKAFSEQIRQHASRRRYNEN